MQRKYYIICLCFALWTIFQTAAHLYFVIYSYYLGICEKSPNDVNLIFFYLTYLYDGSCAHPKITSTSPAASYFVALTQSFGEAPQNVTLEDVVRELLNNLDHFPSTAQYASRTSVFLLCFIILDGTWIICAVALFMGTCCGIKQSLSVAFYGPWLVTTLCVAIFDVTSSVFFGFDLANTTTFSDWMSFVGIEDPAPFPNYDASDSLKFITILPSATLCGVSSRFILVWLSNIIGFVFVMKAAISVYHETYKNERRPNADTSSARIRQWQLFYGTVDANSSRSSRSVESVKDHNSNTNKEERENGGGNYYAYPDVADSVVGELRSQLPWSYTNVRLAGEELEMTGRRQLRLKSVSSDSGGSFVA